MPLLIIFGFKSVNGSLRAVEDPLSSLTDDSIHYPMMARASKPTFFWRASSHFIIVAVVARKLCAVSGGSFGRYRYNSTWYCKVRRRFKSRHKQRSNSVHVLYVRYVVLLVSTILGPIESHLLQARLIRQPIISASITQ